MPLGSPGGAVVKNPTANAGDTRDADSIPGSGRSHGGGNGNQFQYSCLRNLMDKGAWWATVHTTKWLNTHTHKDCVLFKNFLNTLKKIA